MNGSANPLTIVMYHYVRDLPNTRYPAIKGLRTELFTGQLDYLQRYYSIVGFQEVIAAYHEGKSLPPRPCLLTFDDGFIDHYVTVLPILEERGLSAGFFPPAQPVLEHRVDPTHKLHLVLAASPDPDELAPQVLRLLAPFRKEHPLPNDEELYREYMREDLYPYDTLNVGFVKILLNKGLHRDVAIPIVDQLFVSLVSEDETMVAQELYMDLPQLRSMVRHGMYVGGHGYRHAWMETQTREEQEEEIRGTVAFLESVYGHEPSDWVMNYPFGEYNTTTMELLRQAGCAIGLTTRRGLASLSANPLELNRLDTNDIPFSRGADICEWTKKVQ